MADERMVIEGELRLNVENAERKIAEIEKELARAINLRNTQLGVTGTSSAWVNKRIDALTKSLGDAEGEAKKAKNELSAFTGSANAELSATDRIAGGLAQTMAAVFSVKAAKEFVSELANVRGQFQQFEVAMETLLGSKEKSDKLMSESIALAAKTPFYVSDVVGGAKQLLAYGESADTVIDTLRRLGDIAAGVSVPLNRVVAIYGRIQAQGKLTNLTMRQFYSSGIPIVKQLSEQLGKSSAEVQKMISKGLVTFDMVKQAFTDMTSLGGRFDNLMEKQSHTITGHINVIKGLIQNMFNEIGKEAEKPIENVLQVIENLVKNYEKWGKTLATVITTLGAMRAAQVAYVAITKLTTTSLVANSAASIANAKALLANATTTKQAAAAQKALNRAVAANPYVLLATAIAAATAGIIAYTRANNFALQSRKSLNKAVSESAAEASKEMGELNRLKAKLELAEKGTEEYDKARNDLISKFGKYHEGLAEELDKVNGLATAYSALAKSITDSANANAYKAYMEKLEERQTKALEERYDNLLKGFEKKYGKGTVEAYKMFFRTLSELSSETGLTEEMQKEIDSFAERVSYAFGTGVNQSFVMNGVQTTIDNIKGITEETDKWGKAAEETFGEGAHKTELEKALERLNDADLSKLLGNLEKVREQVNALEGGGDRSLTFNDTLYTLTNNGKGKSKDKQMSYVELPQGSFSELETAAEREKQKREEDAAANAEQERLKRLQQLEQAAAAAAPGIRARRNLNKQIESLERERLNIINSATNERIALMKEGSAKELAEAKAEEEQRLQQIEQEKKQYIEKLKDVARAEWKARNPDTKAEWNDAGFKLTEEQERFIEEMFGENGLFVKNATEKGAQAVRKALDNQVKEYGDYYEQRAVTVREWADKIAEEEKRMAAATDESEKEGIRSLIGKMKRTMDEELARADYDFVSEYGGTNQKLAALSKLWEARIANAPMGLKEAMTRRMQEELAGIKMEDFKDSISWDVVFGDVANQSGKALAANMAKVRAYLDANRDKLNVDEIRDLEESLVSMSDELASRNPFSAIAASYEELNRVKASLPGLVNEYKAALAAMNEARESAEARKADLAQQLADGLITETEYTERLAEVDGELDTAQARLNRSGKLLATAQNGVARSTGKLLEGVNALRSTFRGAADDVTGFIGLFDEDAASVIGDTIGLLSELGDIAMEVIDTLTKGGEEVVGALEEVAEGTGDAIEGVSEATSDAISAAESASVILLIVKAVIKVLTAVFSIVNANKEAAREAAVAAREYAQALKELDDAARMEGFSNAFGGNGYGLFRVAQQIADEAKKAAEALFSTSSSVTADMRSGWQKFWGTGSSNKNTVSIMDFYDENGLFNLDKLKAWYDEYGDYLSDGEKDLVDNLIAEWERYERAMEEVTSYLEELFGNTASSVADAMITAFEETGDALADLEDIASSTGKAIAKSLVTSMLMDNVFTPEKQEEIKNMLLAGNTAGAISAFNGLLDQANALAPQVTELLKGLDIVWDADARSGERKGIAQASQDSIDELNGRATVIQTHTYTINKNVEDIQKQNSMLVGFSSLILNEVQGIHRDTQDIKDDIADVVRNTTKTSANVEWLVTKGIHVN